MAAKNPSSSRIIDVAAPDQTVPSATGRPILVTNRPVLTKDPMMTDESPQAEQATNNNGPVMNRQAKTIVPITADETESAKAETATATTSAEDNITEEPNPEKPEEPTVVSEETKESPSVKPDAEEPPQKDAEPAVTPTAPSEEPAEVDTDEAGKDTPEAAKYLSDEEVLAAKASDEERVLGEEEARRLELEQLIASGKYAVPIDALGRKRSRMVTAVLTVSAIVLGLILFNAALDSNVISVPSIPHTHLFQGK
jgi:hypothetical protein